MNFASLFSLVELALETKNWMDNSLPLSDCLIRQGE